jgi:asparagine synthase (glutamine-hydrolysing)
MHGINMLPHLREHMDVNLTGWDGGTVMGHPDQINPTYNQPIDEDAVLAACFRDFNQTFTWPGITEAEERLLYTPAFFKQVEARAFESMRDEFHRFWDFKQHYAAEYFYIVNHCWRLTQNMVTLGRSHLEYRFPFWDYDLIDFLYSLRPEIRANQILYRDIITRETPRLALIPYDKREFLPSINRTIHNLHALNVQMRRRLHIFPHHPTLYADYEQYLRTDLRSWAEGILYDQRTQERGIFNTSFVHSLMERHLAEQEEWTIGKVAPLITFEMMLRLMFDET